MSIDITILCEDCGTELDADNVRNKYGVTIEVERCPYCTEADKNEQ